MASVYQQYPLNEKRTIRVLRLKPAFRRSEPLVADLESCKLDSRPDYDALSYTWGPKEPTKLIECNGRIIQITPNLFDALLSLRYRSRSRSLWIDAICIDQPCEDEKSHQVPLMPEIYGAAKCVRVWLGPGHRNSRDVFRLFSRISLLYQLRLVDLGLGTQGTKFVVPVRSSVSSICSSKLVQKCLDLRESCRSPMRSPYWTRAWTVQEIAMARKIVVMTGRSSIAWKHFVTAALFLHQRVRSASGYTHEEDFARFDLEDDLLVAHFALPTNTSADLSSIHNKANSQNILQAMSQTSDVTRTYILSRTVRLKAENPRDKVYAMLWAVNDVDSDVWDVKYSKSIHTIYTEFSAALIIQDKNLSLLGLAVNTATKCDLPSWVIDWEHEIPDHQQAVWETQHVFSAAGSNSDTSPEIVIVGTELYIRGCRICKTKKSFPIVHCLDEQPETPQWFRSWSDFVESLLPAVDYLNSLSGNEATWKDFVLSLYHITHPTYAKLQEYAKDEREWQELKHTVPDRTVHHTALGPFSCLIDLLRISEMNPDQWLLDVEQILHEYSDLQLDLVMKKLSTGLVAASETGSVTLSSRHDRAFAAIFETCAYSHVAVYEALYDVKTALAQKSLFITKDHQIGTGPQNVKEGHEIVLVPGSKMPLILEPINTLQWRLVGTAHIDGMMYGERWSEEGSISEDEQFRIV